MNDSSLEAAFKHAVVYRCNAHAGQLLAGHGIRYLLERGVVVGVAAAVHGLQDAGRAGCGRSPSWSTGLRGNPALQPATTDPTTYTDPGGRHIPVLSRQAEREPCDEFAARVLRYLGRPDGGFLRTSKSSLWNLRGT